MPNVLIISSVTHSWHNKTLPNNLYGVISYKNIMNLKNQPGRKVLPYNIFSSFSIKFSWWNISVWSSRPYIGILSKSSKFIVPVFIIRYCFIYQSIWFRVRDKYRKSFTLDTFQQGFYSHFSYFYNLRGTLIFDHNWRSFKIYSSGKI